MALLSLCAAPSAFPPFANKSASSKRRAALMPPLWLPNAAIAEDALPASPDATALKQYQECAHNW